MNSNAHAFKDVILYFKKSTFKKSNNYLIKLNEMSNLVTNSHLLTKTSQFSSSKVEPSFLLLTCACAHTHILQIKVFPLCILSNKTNKKIP